MPRATVKIMGLMLAGLLLAHSALAEPAVIQDAIKVKPGNISCLVLNRKGKAVAATPITVRQGKKEILVAKTDAKGRCPVGSLPAGTYALMVGNLPPIKLVVDKAAANDTVKIVLPPAKVFGQAELGEAGAGWVLLGSGLVVGVVAGGVVGATTANDEGDKIILNPVSQ